MQHSKKGAHSSAGHDAPERRTQERAQRSHYAEEFVASARGQKAASSKEGQGARDTAGSWDLGPKHLIDWDKVRPISRILFACLFVFAVCLFWPSRPKSTVIASSTAENDSRRPPNMESFSLPVLTQGTPRPTHTNAEVLANSAAVQQALDDASSVLDSISEQQKKELEEAETSDNKETMYSSAEDYFGSDDVFLDFYDIMEDVHGPVPTTPIVDGSDATPTPGPGGSTPTTPITPGSGPVLQGTPGAACVNGYNAWPDELKVYTYNTAQAYGISYEMVLAIIYHESRFNAGSTHLNTNGTTDWGLMQINDVCFSLLQRQLGISSMSDLLDPYKAIQAGCAILAYHLAYTGNEDDALLRYQVGNGNYLYYKSIGAVPACHTNTLAIKNAFVAAGV
jgi:hypothetical protein